MTVSGTLYIYEAITLLRAVPLLYKEIRHIHGSFSNAWSPRLARVTEHPQHYYYFHLIFSFKW